MTTAGPSGYQITVSMPYYACPATLGRAVESVLGQTHRDLTLVVVNDGDRRSPWPLLADIDDDRLVRFDLAENRGRYFADAIVLQAAQTDWFFIHDADDWCNPELLETYLSAALDRRADVVFGAHVVHDDTLGPPTVQAFTEVLGPVTDEPMDVAPHQALFRTELLRAIGGNYGGLRIGYDTLLVNLARLAGRVTHVDAALYHRVARAGSLTSAPDTGFGSRAREQAARQIAEIYGAVHARWRDAEDPTKLRATMAAAISSHVSTEDRRQLLAHAAELQSRLRRPGSRRCSMASLLDRDGLFVGGWAIHRELATELAERLHSRQPRTLLEIGSGQSTLLLAAYAAGTGARVVTLEHDAAYADRTRRLLQSEGLEDRVALVVAPLAPFACGVAGCHPWYRHDLTDTFDFVLVDGPPLEYGRQAVFFALEDHLAAGWEAWLDDAERPHEQSCLRLWRESLGLAVTEVGLCRKRLAILTASPPGRTELPLEDMVVAVEARSGPDEFDGWAACLDDVAPGLLDEATVVVAAADRPTGEQLPTRRWIDQVVLAAPVAGAMTAAVLAAAATTTAELVLHVTDDWTAASADRGGLARAATVLRARPDIAQVRLVHAGEACPPSHPAPAEPIGWARRRGWAASASAPATRSPSLMRRADLARLALIIDDADVGTPEHELDVGSAQLLPGLFHRHRR